MEHAMVLVRDVVQLARVHVRAVVKLRVAQHVQALAQVAAKTPVLTQTAKTIIVDGSSSACG